MRIHKLYRDGKLFDEMDADTRATSQIARSFAHDFPGSQFTLKDENGEAIYECKVTINPPKQWKVANGPFTTGGEVTIEETNS